MGSRGLNLDQITVKIFKFFPCGPEHLDGVDILNKSILFKHIHIQVGLSNFTNDFQLASTIVDTTKFKIVIDKKKFTLLEPANDQL